MGRSVDGSVLGNVTVKLSHGDPEQKAGEQKTSLGIFIYCQCVFGVTGDLPPKSELSQAEGALLNASVLQISWPYIRAQVNNMTSVMSISAITLPLMHAQLLLSSDQSSAKSDTKSTAKKTKKSSK